MLRTLSLLAILALGVILVLSYLVLGPWVAPPEDPPEVIEARWAKIAAWSQGTPDSVGSPGARERLVEALRALERSDIHAVLDRDADPERALNHDDLDPDAREALDALLRWSAAGPGLGDDPCIQDEATGGLDDPGESPLLQPLPLLRLAELAIRTSSSPDDPQITAALELGHALRGRGPVIYGAVGSAIADKARAFALARRWSPTANFRRTRPTNDHLFGIAARESYCQVRMIERAIEAGDPLQGPDRDGWRGLVQDRVGIDREVQMFRWYTGKHLVAAHPLAHDPPALLRALTPPDEHDLPQSLLLRAAFLNLNGPLTRYTQHVAAYDQFLAD